MEVTRIIKWLGRLYQLNYRYIHATLQRRRYPGQSPYTVASPDDVLAHAQCTFVLSTGRCGTALLTKIFELSPCLDVFHLPQVELLYPSKLAYLSGHQQQYCYEIATLHARYEMIRKSYTQELIYVETNNRITFYAPFLDKLFRNSKYIHVVRHPGDFVRSGLRRGYYVGHVADEGRIVPRKGSSLASDWDCLPQISKIAWLWNETNAFIENFKASIDQNRIMEVKSEDLFKQPKIAKGLFEFIGIESPPIEKLSRIIAEPVNVQKEGNVSPYSTWTEEEKKRLKEFTPLANLYGYEM